MKKLILMVLILASIPLVAQTTKEFYTAQGKTVVLDIPMTLSKAATNYSDPFSLDGYLPNDSTHFFQVLWQASDSCKVTITLQVRNTLSALGSTYSGSWQTAATIESGSNNTGADSLFGSFVFQRGVVSGLKNAVNITPYGGNQARLVVAFANQATVGDSGKFRAWVVLKKQ